MKNYVTTFKKEVKAVISAMEKTDTKSKDLFELSVKIMRDSVSIKEAIKNLDDIIETINTQKHFKQRVKRVIKVASIAVETKLMVDVDKLKWYNIERATKLLEHLQEYFVDDVNKIKNKLNRIKNKYTDKIKGGFKIKEYNDEYDTTLSELMKNYKLEDDEEKVYTKVETMVNKLSPERMLLLITKLYEEHGDEFEKIKQDIKKGEE